jgi:hypothetical protein
MKSLPPETVKKIEAAAIRVAGVKPGVLPATPAPPATPPGRRKYGNKKLVTPDGKFDSKREWERWCLLKLRLKGGVISHLERQKWIKLVVNGVKIGFYVADHVYIENGKRVVEDVKGFPTPVYKLKKRLLLAIHGIEVREV